MAYIILWHYIFNQAKLQDIQLKLTLAVFFGQKVSQNWKISLWHIWWDSLNMSMVATQTSVFYWHFTETVKKNSICAPIDLRRTFTQYPNKEICDWIDPAEYVYIHFNLH